MGLEACWVSSFSSFFVTWWLWLVGGENVPQKLGWLKSTRDEAMSIGGIVVACGLLYWSLVGGWTNNQEYGHRNSVDVGALNRSGVPAAVCLGSEDGSEDWRASSKVGFIWSSPGNVTATDSGAQAGVRPAMICDIIV
jgi:hypothetical protein